MFRVSTKTATHPNPSAPTRIHPHPPKSIKKPPRNRVKEINLILLRSEIYAKPWKKTCTNEDDIITFYFWELAWKTFNQVIPQPRSQCSFAFWISGRTEIPYPVTINNLSRKYDTFDFFSNKFKHTSRRNTIFYDSRQAVRKDTLRRLIFADGNFAIFPSQI